MPQIAFQSSDASRPLASVENSLGRLANHLDVPNDGVL